MSNRQKKPNEPRVIPAVTRFVLDGSIDHSGFLLKVIANESRRHSRAIGLLARNGSQVLLELMLAFA